MVDMPLSTTLTFGLLATQRSAQEEMLLLGAASFKREARSCGSLESEPPFTGSMMTIGIPSFSARA